MHKFQISSGKVTYRNRHLNREAEHYIEAENQEPSIMLWNDPCGTLLGRAFSLFKQAGVTTSACPIIDALRSVKTQFMLHHTPAHAHQGQHRAVAGTLQST